MIPASSGDGEEYTVRYFYRIQNQGSYIVYNNSKYRLKRNSYVDFSKTIKIIGSLIKR
jgi:hypothetical protein